MGSIGKYGFVNIWASFPSVFILHLLASPALSYSCFLVIFFVFLLPLWSSLVDKNSLLFIHEDFPKDVLLQVNEHCKCYFPLEREKPMWHNKGPEYQCRNGIAVFHWVRNRKRIWTWDRWKKLPFPDFGNLVFQVENGRVSEWVCCFSPSYKPFLLYRQLITPLKEVTCMFLFPSPD